MFYRLNSGGGGDTGVALLENPVTDNKITFEQLEAQCKNIFGNLDKKVSLSTSADLSSGNATE